MKIALVTGTSRGLGKEIFESFNKLEMKTFGCSRKDCDVSNYSKVKNLIESIIDKHKRIDVAVCNAGIYGPIGLLEENNLDEWKKCIETNLYGVVNVCHSIIPYMKKQKSGKIIILSGGGATQPMPNFSAYAASKAGVVRFAETIAHELLPWNIDVNAVAPGMLLTDMVTQVIDAGPKAGNDFYEYNKNAFMRKDNKKIMLKAVDLINFLASDESNGITGKLIAAQWDDWKNFDRSMTDNEKYTLRRVK